jgi:hypothetical protein
MKRRKILVVLAILLVVASSGVARADNYFVYDQWGGTWLDANKTYTDDSMMCWAAAASNILAWAGYATPTYNTQSLIFQYFADHWTNAGSLPKYGWNWFLNGVLPPAWSGWSQVSLPGGNFWPADSFSSLYQQATGGNLMASMADFFNSGDGVTLAIYKSGGGHALTCWGYDYTTSYSSYTVTISKGHSKKTKTSTINSTVTQYSGVWVTDSDDGVTGLEYYPVSWDSTNGVWDLGGRYAGWYIGGIEALGRNLDPLTGADSLTPGLTGAVPLPPALFLFLSGLLALAPWRRGRRDHPDAPPKQ